MPKCLLNFKNEIQQTSNLSEDKEPLPEASSDKNNKSLEVIERRKNIEEVIEPVKRDIEIYGNLK